MLYITMNVKKSTKNHKHLQDVFTSKGYKKNTN